mmetsp:Transcript_7469/g.17907  ORF Transcript_7469/g.17907 Transcript_7469/m.17907 type:complete len:284 (+) Transcript_7469:564-1415(+)
MAPFLSSPNRFSSTAEAPAASCICSNLTLFSSAAIRAFSAAILALLACSFSSNLRTESSLCFLASSAAFICTCFAWSLRLLAWAAATFRIWLRCSAFVASFASFSWRHCSIHLCRVSCSSCCCRFAIASLSLSSLRLISQLSPRPGVHVGSNSVTFSLGTFSSARSCLIMSILRCFSRDFSSANCFECFASSCLIPCARTFLPCRILSWASFTFSLSACTSFRLCCFISTSKSSSLCLFFSNIARSSFCRRPDSRFSSTLASRAWIAAAAEAAISFRRRSISA